jgi:hypothetical protein
MLPPNADSAALADVVGCFKMPLRNKMKRTFGCTSRTAHICVGQLSLSCREIRAACICTMRLMECKCICLRLKTTWQLATNCQAACCATLECLGVESRWSCPGVQDRRTVSYQVNEALCLRWRIYLGVASHVLDTTISQSSIVPPRVNARQVGMPVCEALPANSANGVVSPRQCREPGQRSSSTERLVRMT